MPAASRIGDTISGTTTGEHNGHLTPHPICSISGTIASGGSPNVFINGLPASVLGDITSENDCCDSGRSGTVSQGSSTVFINGKPAVRVGDALQPHNGTANVSGGSSNVFIGG